MPLLYFDSFDHEGFTEGVGDRYDDKDGVGFASAAGRTGQALVVGSGDQALLTKTVAAMATWVVGMAVNETPQVSGTFLEILDGSTPQVYLTKTPTHHVDIRRGDGTLLATSTSQLSGDFWTYLQFKVNINNSGSYGLMFNRIMVASGSADTQNSANASATSVRFGAPDSSFTYNIDDFYLADDEFQGALKIECLRPTASGATTGWSPSGGLNWSLIDATAATDDNSYIFASAVNTKDTYIFGNMAAATGEIKGLQLGVRAMKDDGLTREIAPIVRHDGVDYPGDTSTLNNDYTTRIQLYTTNPGTSGAWTVPEINACEFGQTVVT